MLYGLFLFKIDVVKSSALLLADESLQPLLLPVPPVEPAQGPDCPGYHGGRVAPFPV